MTSRPTGLTREPLHRYNSSPRTNLFVSVEVFFCRKATHPPAPAPPSNPTLATGEYSKHHAASPSAPQIHRARDRNDNNQAPPTPKPDKAKSAAPSTSTNPPRAPLR